MSAIDTLLFDLGNVLIRWDPRNLYGRMFGPDTARMEYFLEHVCSAEWNRALDAGRPFAEAIAELQVRHPEYTEHIAAWRGRWPEMLGGAIDGTVDILRELKTRGTRLYALSNWSAETFPLARDRFPFLQWFDRAIISGHVGMAKPDPGIFDLAIRECALVPARTLFVDDLERNADAARAAGMHALVFRDPDQLRDELRGHGLVD
jgi:2-haloacid dehalogenase